MIKNTELTVVIQGAVSEVTNRTVESVRMHYPGAKVIVSTCGPLTMEIIGADEVVVVPDPGNFAWSTEPDAGRNNVNRQIANTLGGLRAVTTPYAMKLRSDFLVTGGGALSYLCRFPAFDPEYRVFRERILALYSPDPRVSPRPFHPNDQCFLGRTDDLIDLFDVPLMTAEEAIWRPYGLFKANRYAPEQHIFINYLRKKGRSVACDVFTDATPENCEETERYYASNFVIMGFPEWQVVATKEHLQIEFNPRAFIGSYTFVGWQKLYRTYVDPAHPVPEHDADAARLETYCRLFKRLQPIVNLIAVFFRPAKTRNPRRRKLRRAILMRLYRRAGLIDENVSNMDHLW